MKNLLNLIVFALFLGLLSSCNDDSSLCPEYQDVKKTEQGITVLEYEKLTIKYSISSMNPVLDKDSILILNHDILKIDLEIERLNDFIDAIKESSDCI